MKKLHISSLEMLIPKSTICLRLTPTIWKLVNSCGVVKQFYQKEMSDSEEKVSLKFKTDGAVLETPLLDLPPRQSFVSVLRRVRRWQVDVGNVLSNSFKERGR